MKEYELTRKDTKMLQGIAIVLMLTLHLFCRLDWKGLFQPIVFIRGIPLTYYLAQMSDCCVMIYAFCSGYGHYVSNVEGKVTYSSRLKKLFMFLINYWIVVSMFVILGLLIGTKDIPGNVLDVIGNYTALNETYNGTWWYVLAYIIVVLLSPILIKCVRKKSYLTLVLFGVLYCMGYFLRYNMGTDTPFADWGVERTGKILMTLFEYVLGCVCCKEKIVSRIINVLNRFNRAVVGISILFVFVGVTYVHTVLIGSMIIAPFIGMFFIIVFKWCKKPIVLEKTLLYLGFHSTNIWLTHAFFAKPLFNDIVYKLQYPIFMFIGMLGFSIIASYMINVLYIPLARQLKKCGIC